MSRAFKVGDLIEFKEGTSAMKGRQFGVPHTVVGVSPGGAPGVQVSGGNGETGNDWFGSNEVRLWWEQLTVTANESTAQDATRGVFVSVELDGDMSAEFNVKVYADVLSALKDSNGTSREVFFVPYPTAKAGSPVWEEIR